MTKPKLAEQQFFLIINGPSCGGKSSVAKIISDAYGGIYNGRTDAIKWLISDYTWDVYSDIVRAMTFETMKVALANNLSLMTEGTLYQEQQFKQLAADTHVPLFIINVEAPWDVLMKRFEERIEAKKQGARIANTDPVRFKELYTTYNQTKPETPYVFDSSQQSPEEIAQEVITMIKKHFEK